MTTLPFELDCNDHRTLSVQMADGFRIAILSGAFKVGNVLPSLRDIAKATGHSIRIPREAMALLEKEGHVITRQGVGCVVQAAGNARWRGHVLVVLSAEGETSYYTAACAGETRRILNQEGYLVTRVAVPRRKAMRYDITPLLPVLRQRFDLAIVQANSPQLKLNLARMGIPFVVVGNGGAAKAKGNIPYAPGAAVEEFVRHCRDAGIRTVEHADFECEDGWGIESALRREGISVSMVDTQIVSGVGHLEGVTRSAFNVFRKRFASRRPLPDLFLFTDDFVASGALTASLAASVRIPEDVRVVTLANRGFGPVYAKSLTRFEMDPIKHGATVARAALALLEGGEFPSGATLEPTYVVGESFPAASGRGA